jgi:hypothetical protein
MVVRNRLPRTAPRNPRRRMSRSTVQRATRWPSRLSWAHTLSAPYTPKFSACTLAISPHSSSSRIARVHRGRRFADQYVDGANCKALQIGSTPNRDRCASM